MKKKLIKCFFISTLATTCIAADDKFYLRLDAGAGMFLNPAPVGTTLNTKLDNKIQPLVNFGIGGYIEQKARLDLNFTYYIDNYYPLNLKSSTAEVAASSIENLNLPNISISKEKINAAITKIANTNGITDLSVKIDDMRISLFSIVPRLYYDYYDFKAGKLFFGVGMGYANIKTQLPFEINFTQDDKQQTSEGVLSPTNTTNNLAYSLHAGFDYKISDMGHKLNVEYYYANYGAPIKDSNLKMISHNLTLGIRYAL